jgi:hypothetical protein
MLATYVLMFCRITLALLFIFSFGSKLLALRDFTVAIGDFKLLPRRWSRTVALLFLGGEIATSVLVTIGGGLLPSGFLLATALLAVFSLALIMALWRKIDMSCNCFGRTERRISHYDVIRNVFLILCCLIGLWVLRNASQGLSSGEIILLTLMSAVILVFATNLSDVVEALRRPFSVTEERR